MSPISSPFSAMKMIPKFKSSSKYPQQQLRREQTLSPLDDGNGCNPAVEADNIELFLSSLEGLEDDYGSYAPITPLGSLEYNSSFDAGQRSASNMLLDSSLESDASETGAAVEGERKIVNPSNCFKRQANYDKAVVSEITKNLAMRIEIGSESGSSMDISTFNPLVSPSGTPRAEMSFGDSYSCYSDAETEVLNNLTSRFVGTEVSSFDGDLNEIEVEMWKSLASTFVAKDDSLVLSNNSLCETVELDNGQGTNADLEVKQVLIASKQCEEVELLLKKENGATSSQASSLSSSTHSSSSLTSSDSNSSQGILLPPKRAIGMYDPFGKETDFSIPGVKRPKRRVQFSNMSKLDETSGLEKLMEVQLSDTKSECSDDSSTSFEYLLNWCGVADDEYFHA